MHRPCYFIEIKSTLMCPFPVPLFSEIKSQYELDAAWQYPFYIAARIRVNNNNWYLFAISFVFIFLLSVLQ